MKRDQSVRMSFVGSEDGLMDSAGLRKALAGAAFWIAMANPLFAMFEGSLLYFPSHAAPGSDLQEWSADGKFMGYSHTVAAPRMVWLMFHGNAGQASQRGYIRASLPATDSVFVMEYPGYGRKDGSPSMKSINAAATEAYAALVRLYPGVPIGVIGESLGSGPASFLCSLSNPPSRLVLIVPFDNLVSVAKERVGFLPVSWLMRDKWDNEKALSKYSGRVDIYGALEDTVIPVHHARHLAASLPGAKYHELKCGHNDWSAGDLVRIE